MRCAQCWGEEKVVLSNWKEIVHVRANCYQYTTSPPVNMFYVKALILYMMCFFLYHRNFDIIKYVPSLPRFSSFLRSLSRKDLAASAVLHQVRTK